VSKLHAHFLLGTTDKTLRLADAQSANGTLLNGRPLAPGETPPLRSGDKIRFGALDVELLDAAAFYAILAAM
jgi:pSer/pThr/pTyr-binding forkhead associated (FHA) protein